jgi:hypothetical protein
MAAHQVFESTRRIVVVANRLARYHVLSKDTVMAQECSCGRVGPSTPD